VALFLYYTQIKPLGAIKANTGVLILQVASSP
jgi:hypothetical protein